MGLECAVANELIKERAKWHQEIYPDSETVQGDVTDPEIFNKLVKLHKSKGCEIVFSSPPCQSFSRANTSSSKTKDKRTVLFMDLLKYIKEAEPKWVMIENVPDFLFSAPKNIDDILKGDTIGQYIKKELKGMGYKVNMGVFSGADYGTAQGRVREIILASKQNYGSFPNLMSLEKFFFTALTIFRQNNIYIFCKLSQRRITLVFGDFHNSFCIIINYARFSTRCNFRISFFFQKSFKLFFHLFSTFACVWV